MGTDHSLLVGEDGTFQWGEDDCEVCLFGDDDCDVPLEHLARMQGIDPTTLDIAPPDHVQAFGALGVQPRQVPWLMALGPTRFRQRLQEVVQGVQNVIRSPEVRRYVKTYRRGREFLRDLRRPTVDPSEILRLVESCDSGESVRSSLRSFLPRDGGHLAPPITYSQVSTLTGRLVVDGGPSVLTLPKKYRKIIRSTTGGSIFSVDFVSLEPRFVLHTVGEPPPADIYDYVRWDLFRGEVDRSVVKIATISALYGSSPRALIPRLEGTGLSARAVVRRVKEYFKVSVLGARLTADVRRGGLHNWYGRPIESNRSESEPKLINHYVQSSCVDTALLGFSKLNESFKSLNARPIYVIHDAVLVDVPAESEREFHDLCVAGVDLDVGHFNLSIEKVS